ncbi:hypothetical protein NMY22_g3199 [Coprinellus aureogranulatus]|nr:hypothetical protein NMY22_g3199 [Coprinellus aureogranulatus]
MPKASRNEVALGGEANRIQTTARDRLPGPIPISPGAISCNLHPGKQAAGSVRTERMLNREAIRSGFVEAREAGAHWDAIASGTATLQDYKRKSDMLERKVAKLKRKVQDLHSAAKLKHGKMCVRGSSHGRVSGTQARGKGAEEEGLRVELQDRPVTGLHVGQEGAPVVGKVATSVKENPSAMVVIV